jgi:hypothetical protein
MTEQIPKDFDWREYISLYPDLRHMKTKEEAELHWKRYGIKEGRVYKKSQIITIPSNFDWKDYINFNEDLIEIFDEDSALGHWKSYGYKENRFISKKHFLEKYPYFNMDLYSKYLKECCDIDTDLSEDLLIKLFFDNPLIFRNIEEKIYHIEPMFVRDYDVEKISNEKVKELNELHLCCRPCFEKIHLIQPEKTLEIENYYTVIQKRIKKQEFRYLINYNICMFHEENFNIITDKIKCFAKEDSLLVVTMRQGFSINNIQKIIEFCKTFRNFVLLRFNRDDFLDIPFLYISHYFINKNKITYKIIFTVHSKRDKVQLIRLLQVLNDNIDKNIELMLSKDIYYLYNSENTFPLDLRNFRVISKLYPEAYKNKYIRFCSGTIFLARKELFDKLFEVIPISSKIFSRFNRRYFFNTMYFSITLDDVIERMFGIINYFHFSRDFLIVFVLFIDSLLKLEVLKININMFLNAGLKNFLIVYSVPQPEEVYRSFSQNLENFLNSIDFEFLYIEKVENNNTLKDFHKYRVATEIILDFFFTKFKHFIFINDSIIVVDSSGKFLREFSEFCRDSDLIGLISSKEGKYHYQSYMFGCNRIRKFKGFFCKFSPSATAKEMELSLYKYFSNNSKCFIETSRLSENNFLYFCDENYFELLKENVLPIIKIKRLIFEKTLNEKLERKNTTKNPEFIHFENMRKRGNPPKMFSGIPEEIYKKLEDENLTYLLKYI